MKFGGRYLSLFYDVQKIDELYEKFKSVNTDHVQMARDYLKVYQDDFDDKGDQDVKKIAESQIQLIKN